MSNVPPSVLLTAFSCPHCGALAHQFWNKTYCASLANGEKPSIFSKNDLERIMHDFKTEEAGVVKHAKKLLSGVAFTDQTSGTVYSISVLHNIYVSTCYHCKCSAVWIRDKLLYPADLSSAVPCNPDLPEDIKRDYAEAAAILQSSPRGAAALLRLAIQKLCLELGQKGKNINEDIAALVKNGLDVKVQQALDIVRVIGNSAVHPGQIDIRDDLATAETLFKLVNLIVEKTISEPRQIAELYGSLPANALTAIEKRDK